MLDKSNRSMQKYNILVIHLFIIFSYWFICFSYGYDQIYPSVQIESNDKNSRRLLYNGSRVNQVNSGFDIIFSDENPVSSSSLVADSDLALLNKTVVPDGFGSIEGDDNTYENSNINQNDLSNNYDMSISGRDGDGSGSLDDTNENTNSVESTEGHSDYKIYSLPAKITLSILATTASFITVCGNLLVMCSFFLDRQIRNPTNYFILSLSVSDFLIGLFSMPFLTLYLMIGEWPFGEIICNLWLSLDYTVCLTSIYTVLFITIDRFCSVKIPAKYRKWRSPNKIIVMVMLTWVIPVSLFFTSIFAWSFSRTTPFDPKNCDVAWSSNTIFSVTLVFSYFWTTLVVIIVLYIFIYQVARNLERKSRAKQRKLSSLVGCSATNTGALVGVVALPPSINTVNKLAKANGLTTPEEEHDDDFNTDSQSKLSKGSIKRRKKDNLKFIKRSSKSGASNMGLGTANQQAGKNANNDAGQNNSLKPNQSINSSKNSHGKPDGSPNASYSKKQPAFINQIQTKDGTNAVLLKTSNITNSGSNTTGATNKSPNMNNSNNNNNNNNNTKGFLNDKNLKTNLNKSNNYSYASTISRDDEFSSSYDSHSDYDTNKKPSQPPAPKVIALSKAEKTPTKGNNLSPNIIVKTVNESSKITKPNQDNSNSNNNKTEEHQTSQSLQPRPETLAVMSHDLFAERCASAKQSSSNSANKSPIHTKTVINNAQQPEVQQILVKESPAVEKLSYNSTNNKSQKDSQIPYIDDEFDELSYVLHRRQFGDKENKIPIKEETIVIKSPLKSGFFQKFSSPMKSFSRRSSQKSQTNESTSNNGIQKTKLDILGSQFSSEKQNPSPEHPKPCPGTEEKDNLVVTNENHQEENNSNNIKKSAKSIEFDLTEANKVKDENKDTPANEEKDKLLENSATNELTNTNDANNKPTDRDADKTSKPKISLNVNTTATSVHRITPSSTTTALTVATNDGSSSPVVVKTTLPTSVSNLEKQISVQSKQNSSNNNNNNNDASTNVTTRAASSSRPPAKRKTKHENRARKALRTITFILGAFIFCFAPWHVVSIYNSFCPSCFNSNLYHHFFYSCYFLCYLNSPINPFMYALANQQFRKTFFRILKGDWRRL